MKSWLNNYIEAQTETLNRFPGKEICEMANLFRDALLADRQIFLFGNGGSAANASHFATDLGKGASDVVGRFRVLSLTDNTPWLTALGNDYAYEDVFLRQLMNYARPGDLAFTMSVSGNSPNLVKAVEWANANDLTTIALLSKRRGKLAELAKHTAIIDSDHYGIVEDAHMTICHMISGAFMEKAVDVKRS
jgi:D-sedoheptulose 7-phosphate isomerase